jgi:hypothetical protein
MGKPTWGALGDSLPPTSSTPTPQVQGSVFGNETSDENALGPQGQANLGVHRSKTCWYWANDPKGCANSAGDCKYLHEKCTNGVANKPNSWKKFDWNRFATPGSGPAGEIGSEGEGSGGGHAWTINGDTEMNAGDEGSASHSGWGEESNVYRPPHIKALEDKALAEAVGW